MIERADEASLIDATEEKEGLTGTDPTSVQPADLLIGQMVSAARTAHDYFMHSQNPDAGKDYTERRTNLDRVINELFRSFAVKRSSEYGAARFFYRGIDWNQAGRSSWKTLTCAEGQYFIADSIKHTLDGDWKGGPEWSPNKDFPTSFRWKTGGHRRSETFAEVWARYSDKHIRKMVLEELITARRKLHDLNVSTPEPDLHVAAHM